MEITEVRIKLVSAEHDKLRAYCSITIDGLFVVRDLKIIQGARGAFVAMPSRKLSLRCARCGMKNHHRAKFCNECGVRQPARRNDEVAAGRAKLHADVAHPINAQCRELIQGRVLEVYAEELERSLEPGYRPMEFEIFDEDALRAEGARERVEDVDEAAVARDAREVRPRRAPWSSADASVVVTRAAAGSGAATGSVAEESSEEVTEDASEEKAPGRDRAEASSRRRPGLDEFGAGLLS